MSLLKPLFSTPVLNVPFTPIKMNHHSSPELYTNKINLLHLSQLGCKITSSVATTLNSLKALSSAIEVEALAQSVSPVASTCYETASLTALLGWSHQLIRAKHVMDIAERETTSALTRLKTMMKEPQPQMKELIGEALYDRVEKAIKTQDTQNTEQILDELAQTCFKKIVTTSILITARSVNTGGVFLAEATGGLSLTGPVLGAGWAAFDFYTRASEKIAQELWNRKKERKRDETKEVSIREELSNTDPRFLIQEAFRALTGMNLESDEDDSSTPTITPFSPLPPYQDEYTETT